MSHTILLYGDLVEPQYVAGSVGYGDKLRDDIVWWLTEMRIRYHIGSHDTEYGGRYPTLILYQDQDAMLFKLRWM